MVPLQVSYFHKEKKKIVFHSTRNSTYTATLHLCRPPNIHRPASGLGSGVGVAWLVMGEASASDTGLYFCHASSPLGSAPPVVTRLVVQRTCDHRLCLQIREGAGTLDTNTIMKTLHKDKVKANNAEKKKTLNSKNYIKINGSMKT